MIRSMTGYSNARREEPNFSLAVNLKGTNHRFLDLRFRLPDVLEPLEADLRRLVNESVARGHLEITVSFDRAGSQSLQLNERLLEGYVAACEGLRQHFGAIGPPDPVALLHIPGMITSAGEELPAASLDRVRTALEILARKALADFNEMRTVEGRALETDLQTRLGRIRTLAGSVQELAIRVPDLYRKRLEERLRELLGPAVGSPSLEPGRLAQEVVYLVSRSDISEELTRLMSHLDQAASLLDHGTEVGKKLDFLLQEMNREANTILSKTTDVPEAGPEVARQAIEMKTEIEKLREQAQNIE
jgi:uncharacterized protein (TIGR00255 family)